MWTSKFVENVKSSSKKRKRISCPSRSGLGMIISPRGLKTFIFRYNFRTGRNEIKIGNYPAMGLSDARKAVINYQQMLDQGKDPSTSIEVVAPSDDPLLEDAIDLWLESEVKVRVKRHKTLGSYRSIMKVHIKPYFKGRHIRSIVATDLEVRVSEMIADEQYVNSTKAVPRLKDFFKWAKKKYRLKFNPAIELETPAKRKARSRNLSPAELKTFAQGLSTAPNIYRLPLEFLIRSCQRKSEVIYMPKSELRFSEGLWVIDPERTKNGREHAVPLTERMVEILQASLKLSAERGLEDHDLVFPGASGGAMQSYSLNYYVNNSAKYFGLEEWWIHDLRRTANTQMAAAGVSYEHRERVLNHSPAELDGVYNLYDYLQEKYDALDALDRRLDLVFAGKQEEAKIMPFRRRSSMVA